MPRRHGLHRHGHRFRAEARFSTFIYRVAVNTALDRVRRKQPVYTNVEPIRTVDAPQENERVVAELLTHLKPDARTVLVLCDMQGFSREEASQILAVPVGTVKSRLSHARETARQFLATKEKI